MYQRLSLFIVWTCVVAAILPANAQAQVEQAARVNRMVEGQAKKVIVTDLAEILGPASRQVKPVTEGQRLLFEDTMSLQDQIWIELEIDRSNVQGHAILAEQGEYGIQALQPESPLLFRLRQGRMSVRLKRGQLGVFLKDRLLSILGTEVFLQADPALDVYRVYLKKGHITFQDGSQVFLDVNGKDRAWRWQGNQPPEEIFGVTFDRWKQQMKRDARTVWRKPFFKRGWVQIGAAALVVGAVVCALECSGGSGSDFVNGEVIIDIQN